MQVNEEHANLLIVSCLELADHLENLSGRKVNRMTQGSTVNTGQRCIETLPDRITTSETCLIMDQLCKPS